MVVSTQVGGFSAHGRQFVHDRLFAIRQRFGDGPELRRQFGIVALRGQRFGPIAGEPIVAVAVVGLAHFPARGAVVIQNALGCGLNRLAQHTRFGITTRIGQELETFAQRAEFAQAVPAQVIFFHQLLDVFRGRTARAGLKQTTTLHQLHDRQHLGRGGQFQDREQIGEVVAQNVAGDRDGVFALPDRLKRRAGCFARGEDLELVGHAFGFQNRGDVFDQLGIMGAVCVQPEDRLAAFGLLAVNGQVHPVFDRGLAGRGGAPDVALFHGVFVQYRAIVEDHLDGACGRHLERCGVRSVFFGLLGHQADVLHRAGGGRVQFAGFFEILDRLVIDGRIGIVGDDAIGVGLFPVRTPTFAACTDQSGHRGVDDHIGRHMQVGDAFVAVNHVHRRAVGHDLINSGHDLGLVFHAGQQIAQARVRVHTQRGHLITVLVEDRRKEGLDRVTKDDRVRDLHHRGFHVEREQRAFVLGLGDLVREERIERFGGHECSIHHRASGKADAVFQNRFRSISGDMHDLGGCFTSQRRRGFVREEIPT